MKKYWVLAIGAFVVLSLAAIWLGALNQDEGWYLYAANLAAEGKCPYRDFAFTQGPVMPFVYSFFVDAWQRYGLLGARAFNTVVGLIGILFACALARRVASEENKNTAPLVTFLLLATNLYHLYFLAIPKTYALAGLFVIVAFYLLSFRVVAADFVAGLFLAFAAGTRFSLVVLIGVVTICLYLRYRSTCPWKVLFFVFGAVIALGCTFGPILYDEKTQLGFITALTYHTSRGGSDIVWTVGSLSRLVRWYLPIFVVLGLGSFRQAKLLLAAFLAVFAVQIAAPFPYEDYQVPIMALLAVFAAANLKPARAPLLVMGLCFATSFGSPLLQDWMTYGQDRFWSIKKDKTELQQLRETAKRIEAIDPEGKTILTQDLYLAVEMNRKVPEGLEMGPFARLTDGEWRELLEKAPETCNVAALSGYSFAIEPPECKERPLDEQLACWWILENHYEKVFKIDRFGQNATTLIVLERKKNDR